MALKDAFQAALLAGAEGLTDQPYYSNYIKSKNERLKMEQQAIQDQMEQRRQAQLRAMQSQANAMPTRPNMLGYDESTGMNMVQPNPMYSPEASKGKDEELMQYAERRTYSNQGLLPISRTDLLQMSPIERMNYLRSDFVKTSPDGTKYELGPAEARRKESMEMKKIASRGRPVSPNDQRSIDMAENALGMSLPDALKTGRAEWTNGKYDILSDRDWANRKKMPSKTETDDINNRYDVAKSFHNVQKILEEIGDLPNDSKVGFEGEEKVRMPGVGMVSVPARLSFVGQLAKDPKYTAVRRELEVAFQAWRKVVTGAQASYQELKYLREAFPQLTDQPGVFTETIKNIIERNGRELETRFNTWSDVGRDTTKLKERYENEYSMYIPGPSQPDEWNADNVFEGL